MIRIKDAKQIRYESSTVVNVNPVNNGAGYMINIHISVSFLYTDDSGVRKSFRKQSLPQPPLKCEIMYLGVTSNQAYKRLV